MVNESGAATLSVAPGSLVVVRDEEWVVTQVAQTRDGTLVTAQGLSELVTGTTAQFYSELDEIVPLDPRPTRVVADRSKNHHKARLWLEATLRKTALPIDDDRLDAGGCLHLLTRRCLHGTRPRGPASASPPCSRCCRRGSADALAQEFHGSD